MSEARQKIKVQICLGTACFVLGAAELQAVAEEASESWNEIFDFVFVPCLGRCNNRETAGPPPYVSVGDEFYSGLTFDKFYQLLSKIADKTPSESLS